MKKSRLLVMFLICAATSLANCSKKGADGPNMSDGSGKILLIGIDGLEWDVVLPLLRQGRMPNLAHLMSEGTWGQIETYAPAKSPVIWTTIATGKSPDIHGILDFLTPPQVGGQRFYNSRDRKCKAFWNILSDYERDVNVIGWWNTFPVEKEVRGVVVAQTNTMDEYQKRGMYKGGLLRGVPGQVHPQSRQNEMLAIFSEVEGEASELVKGIFGDFGELPNPTERVNWQKTQWTFRSDEAYRRIAIKLMGESPCPDLFAVYFATPDVVGHRFWKYYEPGPYKHPPSNDSIQRLRNIIPDAYVHADKTIGELINAFPRNADVIVLSDHGMHAYNKDLRFDDSDLTVSSESGAHKDGPPGLFVAAGPSFKASGRSIEKMGELQRKDIPTIGRMTDIAPTILALLEVPIGDDMTGSALTDLLSASRLSNFRQYKIATHESPGWYAERYKDPIEEAGKAERLGQLRSLGYIGEGEGETPTSQTVTSGPSVP